MRSMKAQVSDEAYETMQAFMVENGITFGAMIEAYSEMLRDLPEGPRRATFLTRAREIAAERRRRGK